MTKLYDKNTLINDGDLMFSYVGYQMYGSEVVYIWANPRNELWFHSTSEYGLMYKGRIEGTTTEIPDSLKNVLSLLRDIHGPSKGLMDYVARNLSSMFGEGIELPCRIVHNNILYDNDSISLVWNIDGTEHSLDVYKEKHDMDSAYLMSCGSKLHSVIGKKWLVNQLPVWWAPSGLLLQIKDVVDGTIESGLGEKTESGVA